MFAEFASRLSTNGIRVAAPARRAQLGVPIFAHRAIQVALEGRAWQSAKGPAFRRKAVAVFLAIDQMIAATGRGNARKLGAGAAEQAQPADGEQLTLRQNGLSRSLGMRARTEAGPGARLAGF